MIVIQGHSDDIVHYDMHGASDEVGHDCVRFTVGDNARGVVVVMEYAARNLNGWAATVCVLDEDVPLLPTTLDNASNGYSVEVTVRCEPGTPIRIDCWDGKAWRERPEDVRRRALSKLTKEEREALGVRDG